MEKKKKKNTIPKHLNQSYKKKSKNSTRERESTHSFFVGKIWIEWEDWYQIYTNKIGRRRVKLKEREKIERSVTMK